MHRIDNPWALPTKPAAEALGVPGYFWKGDPLNDILATKVEYDWLNSVQEEIAHVIEMSGITLDKVNDTQLYAAILSLVRTQLPPLPFLPLAGGTMQGPIVQPAWPTIGTHLANADYVNNRASAYAENARVAAVNQAYAWDQPILQLAQYIDATQGGIAWFGASNWFTVPSSAKVITVVGVGGGGGGGGAQGRFNAGGGGGAGGLFIWKGGVSPGQSFWVQVGGGGGGVISGVAGAGGSSQFGDLAGATGGSGGGSSDAGFFGAPGGNGYGGGILISGGMGDDGRPSITGDITCKGGMGGSSYFGGGGRSGDNNASPGYAIGSGGGGSYIAHSIAPFVGSGGNGQQGGVIVTWSR